MVIAVLALASVGVASSCSRGEPALTLAGSTSLQPYAERWADAFNVSRPDLPMHIQGGGSTAGVQAALSGAAQIGMSSRRLTPAEASRVTAIPVARDGLAIVVHPSNPVANLTLDEARAIYAGAVRSWRALGGRDVPITIITREEGSGTRAAFEELVMGGRRIASSALVQDSTGAVRQMVASDPAAVGYVSLGLVDASVKALALDGVIAAEAAIDAHRYPLVRPFLFVVPKEVAPAARAFIEWVRGPEGRALSRRQGLLPPEG
jgi:phosphate transport system substrate-binding protein